MLDQIKWYLVQIGLKKYTPIAIMSAIGALGAYMAAHAGMLEQYGVTYANWPFSWPSGQEPSGPCILLELDTLGAKAIAGIAAVAAIAMRAAQHHTTGDGPAIAGGRRDDDPPASPQEAPK